MSLQFLLDENMSQVVATQMRNHRPGLIVESVHDWQGGTFEGRADEVLLQAAHAEALTLVTYDQKTIPPLLSKMSSAGESHGGIIFVDDRTIFSSNFGMLTRALIFLWDQHNSEDWENRISFLKRPI
jgi:hypothetical protein